MIFKQANCELNTVIKKGILNNRVVFVVCCNCTIKCVFTKGKFCMRYILFSPANVILVS